MPSPEHVEGSKASAKDLSPPQPNFDPEKYQERPVKKPPPDISGELFATLTIEIAF